MWTRVFINNDVLGRIADHQEEFVRKLVSAVASCFACSHRVVLGVGFALRSLWSAST